MMNDVCSFLRNTFIYIYIYIYMYMYILCVCAGGVQSDTNPHSWTISDSTKLPRRGSLPSSQLLSGTLLLRRTISPRAPLSDLCWCEGDQSDPADEGHGGSVLRKSVE